MEKKLYRDEYHKVIGGVCSGLAEYFEMDVTVIRLLFAFTVIIMGVGLIPYIVLWIVLPKKGYVYNTWNKPGVDYTVPPQQPDARYTHQGNPFGGNYSGGTAYESNPFGSGPAGAFPPKRKSHAGVIFGLVLIVVGLSILIDEYDLIPNFDFDKIWPAILVLVGASLIVSGQQRRAQSPVEWQDAEKAKVNEPEQPSAPGEPTN